MVYVNSTTIRTTRNTKEGPRNIVINVSWAIGKFFFLFVWFFLLLTLADFLGKVGTIRNQHLYVIDYISAKTSKMFGLK